MTVQRNNTLYFNKRKATGFDFSFIDSQIRQALYVSGTDLNVYRVIGTYDQFLDVTNKSNVSQSFTASPSSVSHRGPDKAFDDNTETYYESSTIPTLTSNEFIRIDFGSEDKDRIVINGFGICGLANGDLPQSIEFQGSPDGSLWDTLGIFTPTTSDTLQKFTVVNDIAYRMYQIVAKDETYNIGKIKIKTIEMYSEAGASGVQDKFFIENRDRKYETTPVSLITWYEIPEKLHNIGLFGFGIPTDQVKLTLLISDTKAVLGRAIMAGDIVSLPHVGNDSNDQAGPSNNGVGKLYEVIDPTVSPDGYDPLWRDHLYAVMCVPLKHRQETYDITGDPKSGYIDFGNNPPTVSQDTDIMLNNEVDREAEHAGLHGQDMSGIYSTQSNDKRAMDGIPNDGSPYTIGFDFPASPVLGQWFLHEGYEIPTLFQWDGYKWVRKEAENRQNMGGRDSQRWNLKDFLESPNPQPIDKK